MSAAGRQAQTGMQQRRDAANYKNIDSVGPSAFMTSSESIYSAVSQHTNYPRKLISKA
jgi:hypothetical protein